MSAQAKEPPKAWAVTATERRYCFEDCLQRASKNYRTATGDQLWPFAADTVIYFVEWLASIDVTVIKHPRLKGCTTGIHGRRVEKLLQSLIALSTAPVTNKRARARVQKARDALLAAIEASGK